MGRGSARAPAQQREPSVGTGEPVSHAGRGGHPARQHGEAAAAHSATGHWGRNGPPALRSTRNRPAVPSLVVPLFVVYSLRSFTRSYSSIRPPPIRPPPTAQCVEHPRVWPTPGAGSMDASDLTSVNFRMGGRRHHKAVSGVQGSGSRRWGRRHLASRGGGRPPAALAALAEDSRASSLLRQAAGSGQSGPAVTTLVL